MLHCSMNPILAATSVSAGLSVAQSYRPRGPRGLLVERNISAVCIRCWRASIGTAVGMGQTYADSSKVAFTGFGIRACIKSYADSPKVAVTGFGIRVCIN